MKAIVGNVEGQTGRKGTKQNRTYDNLIPRETEGFFKAECGTTLWNVNGDWSKLGIMKKGKFRCSYTETFKIEE